MAGLYRMARSRKTYIVVIALAVGLGMVLVMRHGGVQSTSSLAYRPFDSSGWIEGSTRERGMMVRDLIKGGMLAKKSKEEVRVMLGEPDSEGDDSFRYWIDIGHTFGSTPWLYYLSVEFEDGRVRDVYYTD
jgi:hypothetical protein